ncbi:MAG: heme-binding domain-containing protein [Flavobacteriaceae bacterium]|nr:heme-binding domain-containing protein [Flavobacteriaceae bacterium]
MKLKKIVKLIIVTFLILFIGIQCIPTNRNQSNEVLSSDFIKTFSVPKNLATKLKTSCYDCHSNNTYYPWYNKIQPISWFLENHINEAKEELNLATFGDYSNRRQKSKLKSIISQIREDKMPLKSYTIMHSNAIFSSEEKEELLNWLNELRDGL